MSALPPITDAGHDKLHTHRSPVFCDAGLPPAQAPFVASSTPVMMIPSGLYHAKTRRIFRQGSRAMKCSKRSFAVVSVLFALLLSLSAGTLNARDADLASHTFAAAQTAKQKCINTCRARYRDCRRLNQLPSFDCRGVYRDCTRYTCTGLGLG